MLRPAISSKPSLAEERARTVPGIGMANSGVSRGGGDRSSFSLIGSRPGERVLGGLSSLTGLVGAVRLASF